MNQNKLSSRVRTLIKSAFAAAALPILFIYIMIAKPDYRIMNAMGHVVVPVAHAVGDIITWPVRATGNLISNIHELANLRSENEELRARLDAALADKVSCDIARGENAKLQHELDVVRAQPRTTILADVIHDNAAFHHTTFIINKGVGSGLSNGMVVTSTDGYLVGIITDVAPTFSRVRALTDSDSNIAVRVVGTGVYGFMAGNGGRMPTMGFFSDPEFQAARGIKLVTSNISGILPADIPVGTMVNDSDVKTTPVSQLTRVMVLEFDNTNKYK